MKGIILAGGTATRLFPLTTTTSKQLLPVYDRQMVFYPLNTLISAGLKEILIIVAPEHSGQFVNLLGSMFDRTDIKIEFKVQKVPRGLADAFIVGEDFIDNDSVVLILGDNIFEDDFSKFIKYFKSGAQIFAKKVNDPERYGVVKFDKKGKVIDLVEKPKKWVSDYAIPGIYIYDNKVIKIAKSLKPSARGELEITDVNRKYLEMGELSVGVIKGAWLDAGTFDALLEAGRIVKRKKLNKRFHPLIERAIAVYNDEIKTICQKRLL